MAPSRSPMRQRHATTDPRDDTWVDRVADEVSALLREHGLDMELCVWYDPITEVMHGIGFDGSPARFFRSLESDQGGKGQPVAEPESPGPTEGLRSTQVLTTAS